MPALARSQVFELVKKTASRWNEQNAPRLGAALAYYSLLSVAPLLLLIVAICGLVFNKSAAESQLMQQMQSIAGPSGAKALQSILANAHQKGSGILATAVATITLLFGASGVFVELRDALNKIWDALPAASSTWRTLIWQRLVSFGMVLALGFLLLVSLILSAALAVVTKFFDNYLPLKAAIWGHVVNFVVPLIAISVLFALIFKFVPDVPIHWRDVITGAIVTAVLFEIGKALLALYLATAAVGSTYGAAGSLVAFVVWVYYSAQIFFFGAIFTRVYADAVGSHSTGSSPTPVRPGPSLSPAQRGASA